MRDWFETLQSREQMFVGGGGIVVALILLYAGLWLPLDAKHQSLQADVDLWQQSLAELRPLVLSANNNQKSGSSGSSSRTKSPIVIVDETLRIRGLERYRRRSQPTSSNGVRVEFEGVAFDELVLWLGDLSEQYAMDVQTGSFSNGSQGTPGRINATLTLERGL